MTDYSVDKMTINMVNGTIGSASVKQDGRLVGYSAASRQMTGADGVPRWGVFHPCTEIHFTAEDGGGNRVEKTFTFTPLNDCDAETALLRIKGRVAEVKAWADAIKATVPPETCSTTINGHAVTITRTEPGTRPVLTIDGTSYSDRNWTESRLLTDTTTEDGYGILTRDGSAGRHFWRGEVVVNVEFPRSLRIEADAVKTIACVLKKRAEKVTAAFKELENNPVVQVLGKSVTLHVANGYVSGFTIDGKRYDNMCTAEASEALTGLKLCCGAEWIGLPFFVHMMSGDKMVTVEWEDGGNERRSTSTCEMRPEWFASCIEARVSKVKRAIAPATPDPCDCDAKTLVVRRDTPGSDVSFIYDGAAYRNMGRNKLWELSRELTGTYGETGSGIFENDTGLESESFTAMYSDGSTSCERVFTFGDNLNLHTDSIEEIGRKIAVRVGVVKAWADRVRCTLPDQKTGTYTVTL